MPFTDLIDLPAAPLQRDNLGPSADNEARSRARNCRRHGNPLRRNFTRVFPRCGATARKRDTLITDGNAQCTGNVYGARENKTNKVTGAFVFYRYFVGRACGRSTATELSIRVARRGAGAIRSFLDKAALSAR